MNPYRSLIILLPLLVFLMVWLAYRNTALQIHPIPVEAKHLPTEFHGFKIVQISDLHNAEFGSGNAKLISMVKQAKPDIIVITGDVIDSRRTKVDVAILLAKQMVKMAPVYYVSGNHESRILEDYAVLKQGFLEAGVVVLENASADIKIGDAAITLVGLADPLFSMEFLDDTVKQNLAQQLSKIVPDHNRFKVLLAHRPEYFDVYANSVDLVLAGHAHGGQVRLPFIGGVIAPGQGFFPKYDDGLYAKGETRMVVSRGIGNSLFPLRINNRPEIVVVALTKEDA